MGNLVKIVATLGPSTSSADAIHSLANAGMDFARLNFSHGTHEEKKEMIDNIRSIEGKKIKIIQDLPGPKIRLGDIEEMVLEDNKLVQLTSNPGTDGAILVNFPDFSSLVEPGSIIFISDGKIKLKVLHVSAGMVSCIVEFGGPIKKGKGVNIQSSTANLRAVTYTDIDHIKFGVENNVDYIAVSFVRSGEDMEFARQVLSNLKSNIPLIAKIEKSEALDNLKDIIQKSDAVMIARGDLGTEIGVENVPLAQKRIIAMANKMKKPVITATQMLYSMINNKTPTRAEVSDIANAVLDGTDALMFSDETAVGKNPDSVIEVAMKVVETIENADKEVVEKLEARDGDAYSHFLNSAA